nr:deoxynucleoside kinase [Croceifilum oryzae]
MREMGYVICLGGMIGVGKTSYTTLIAQHLNSEAFYESVDDNRLLDLFYNDRERFAFPLQIYFLNTRFRSIKKAMRHKNNVLDRSIYEDALFAKINFEDGMMKEAEFDCYLDLLHNMLEEIQELDHCTCPTGPKKRPDLFIYLRASFETIMERIEKRGRDYEQDPSHVNYFRRLHSRYDDWVFNHYKESDVLIIDADRLDITREEDAAEFLEILDAKLREVDEKDTARLVQKVSYK